MHGGVGDAIDLTIDRWGLDRPGAYPVPIRQLAQDDGWRIEEQSGLCPPIYGYAVIYGEVKIIVVDADIPRTYQRFAIAHEICHVLNDDETVLALCRALPPGGFQTWITQRAERDATRAAARLLIPDTALIDAGSVTDLARLCLVPHEVAELRLNNW